MTANGSVIKELEVIPTVIKRENRHVAYPEDININPSFSVVLLRHRRSSAVLSCSNNNRWSRDGRERGGRGGPSSSFSDPLSLMEVKTRPATVLICSIHRASSLLHLLLIHKLCEEKFLDSTQELDSCFSCRSAQQTLFFLQWSSRSEYHCRENSAETLHLALRPCCTSNHFSLIWGFLFLVHGSAASLQSRRRLHSLEFH